MLAFIAYAEDFEEDTYEFYVRGLDGRDLSTQDRSISMGANNRAFILDFPYDDETYWAYDHYFLGGSMSYDVDVSQVSCDRAAGLFLVQVDDDECSWGPQPRDYAPQCASIDVMTANRHGFTVEAHPCEFGQCDNESLCTRRFSDEDFWNYGYGTDFKINTAEAFNVFTQFYATGDSTATDADIAMIVTTLTQDSQQISVVMDCEDYLMPFSTLLGGEVAIGMSSYSVGENNSIDEFCELRAGEGNVTFSNFRWTNDDAIYEEPAFEVMAGPSPRISDCGDDCYECNQCYMSNDPDNVYPVCNDYRPMRFSSPCPNKGRWNEDICNENGPCFKSYPFGDPEKYRAPDAACRTLPEPYLDLSAMKYGSKVCKTK
jgi:hypothetical protein